jgi:3-hydroxypropanoate dehydrogenase
MPKLDDHALDQVFRSARTFNKFRPDPVSDETLHELHDLMKWGPTSMNCQPGRFVFLRSAQSRERLRPALSAGNLAKTMVAPVVVIVATDSRFYDHLPEQFPSYAAKPMFEGNPALAEATAQRNGTLQGGYLIIAARMLGLDCGPMSGFDNAKVNAEFFADGRFQANFLINLGYGDPSGNYPRNPRLTFADAAQIL